MADDNLVPCAICDTLIEGTHTHQVGPFQMVCESTHCKECEYQENFRISRLVEPKWKKPFPRPGADGRMPKALRDALAKRHQEDKQP